MCDPEDTEQQQPTVPEDRLYNPEVEASELSRGLKPGERRIANTRIKGPSSEPIEELNYREERKSGSDSEPEGGMAGGNRGKRRIQGTTRARGSAKKQPRSKSRN